MDFKFIVSTFKDIIIRGLPVSFEVVIFTLLISLPIGFLIGILRYKKVKVINEILVVIMSFFKGTPLIILIFLFYDAMPSLLNSMAKNFGWSINFFNINVMIMAVVICCSFEIAMLAEVFRSALDAVDKGQLEAAHTVGLSTFQAYIHIIIPQALVSALPNLSNEVVNLLKGTSLVFYMGVQDIMGVAKADSGAGYQYIEAYFDVFVVYVVLCFIIQKLFLLLEKRLSRYEHSR